LCPLPLVLSLGNTEKSLAPSGAQNISFNMLDATSLAFFLDPT